MLTFAVDNLENKHNNLYPLRYSDYTLTEPNWILRWFDYYSIEYSIVQSKNANQDTWYPIGINFWNFNYDYLQNLPTAVKEKLIQGSIRILFIYRESDSPRKIRQHISKMCNDHNIDSDLIWLICGNSHVNGIPNTRFFWYFDCNYFFQTQNSPTLTINNETRKNKITCLSRVHKHWREWFVFNLCRFASHNQNYISYGLVPNDDSSDFNLWGTYNQFFNNRPIDIEEPNESWKSSLPLKADNLSPEQHNQHSIIIPEFFQNSYWNIILETLLATDTRKGVFVTEKTLKPIRNGQSFLILGCQGSLAFLRDQGYKTFSNAIDESYDELESVHDRWYCVLEQAKKLSTAGYPYLDKVQKYCLKSIEHNQLHFQRSRYHEILGLATYLDSV